MDTASHMTKFVCKLSNSENTIYIWLASALKIRETIGFSLGIETEDVSRNFGKAYQKYTEKQACFMLFCGIYI